MGELIRFNAITGKSEVLPTYTCGHCSDIVLMNPNRTRERRKCLKCGHTICEKKSICITECTPLPELARDHVEGRLGKKWGQLVPGIMRGARTVEDALQLKET